MATDRPTLAGRSQSGPGPAVAANAVPVQGRLTDANGSPLRGTYDLTYALYDQAVGGAALCSTTESVSLTNGLFSSKIDSCNPWALDGRQLYLGVRVASDAEMSPRQPLYPVPYAFSLRPGAVIASQAGGGGGLNVFSADAGRSGAALWAQNTDADGIAFWTVANSADASVVIENLGSGPFIKGFGTDGGDDEFRIDNNGAIQTRADSVVFVPGAAMRGGDPSVQAFRDTGAAAMWELGGTREFVIPVSLPAILHGQPVKVKSLTVYYMVVGEGARITGTRLVKQTSTFIGEALASENVDRASTSYTSYTIAISGNNVLSSSQGFLTVALETLFDDTGSVIWLGGVSVQLGHHSLY